MENELKMNKRKMDQRENLPRSLKKDENHLGLDLEEYLELDQKY